MSSPDDPDRSPEDPYRPPPDPYRPPEESRGRSDPPAPPPYFSPVPPPQGPSRPGGGSRGWGVATGIVVPVLVPVLAVALSGPDGNLGGAGVLLSLVGVLPGLFLLGAVVLAVVPGTRRFGTGVLLGLGILLVVGAGTCVALLAGLSAMNA